jgi:catecholate siderophore receptor
MNASLYIAYGNAKTPSQSAVNGACTDATCDVNPEGAVNYEIGGKWDVMDGRLSLTGSVFRNERTNYKVPSDDPTLPAQVLDGQSRVDGMALGASGKITSKLAVFANYTYLDSVVTRGKALICITNPAAAVGCPTPLADPTGRPLTATPKNAASLWATYEVARHWQVGYGLTYQDEIVISNTATVNGLATGPLFTAPGYVVSRAAVTWEVSKRAQLRLNVNNLFDKKYLTNIRTSANGWAEPGAARNATLTLDYRF